MSEQLFPPSAKVDGHESKSPWIAENNKALRELLECLENRNCLENQSKLIILGSPHFTQSRVAPLTEATSAEDIWARSIISALRFRGFTYLVTPNHHRALQLYNMFPDLVRAVFLEPDGVRQCWDDPEFCVLSEDNPDGIPIWKIFSFQWWADVRHPLGAPWILQPEDYTLQHPEWQRSAYIGYTIEESCRSRSLIPVNEREERAYVMTKWSENFESGPETAWPEDYYEAAVRELGIGFVAGANHRDGDSGVELPQTIQNLGQMARIDFQHHIAFSKVLIGVGRPAVSVTPYEALCLGVPFVNPILEWDHENPGDKSKWKSQHESLALLAPPYVYNVRRDDRDGFIQAIKNAVANPIPSYVLPRMRMYSVAFRLNNLIHENWQREAAQVLERRKSGEEQGPLFVL
ncbi:hypothetical protein HWV62_33429 [Athelia sp. TMB]|nr:hypothetical protein HWV62_33429 [Athelia sp. TMB]